MELGREGTELAEYQDAKDIRELNEEQLIQTKLVGELYSHLNREGDYPSSSQLRPQLNSELERSLSHGEVKYHMFQLFGGIEDSTMEILNEESDSLATRYRVEIPDVIGAARDLRKDIEPEKEPVLGTSNEGLEKYNGVLEEVDIDLDISDLETKDGAEYVVENKKIRRLKKS